MTGRLPYFLSAWESITSDKAILQTVKGYKIPFAREVRQNIPPTEQKFSTEEIRDISKAIQILQQKKAVVPCNPCEGQFLSPYFLADKPNKEKRFILNLKNLNKFIDAPHFKMEDRKIVTALMFENCFMAVFDLKDAYFLIAVDPEFRKYLRFTFQNQLYEFTCIPFGLSVAPYLFTKLTKPVVHQLRDKGLISVIYLDDMLLISKSYKECLANIQETRNLLEFLGFVLNLEKCCLIPSKTCKFLGYNFNSEKLQVELPDKKKEKILKELTELKEKMKPKIRDVAKCLGLLISACPATKYGILYTKVVEREKYLALQKSEGNFDKHMSLSKSAIEELNWWIDKIPRAVNPILKNRPVLEIFSDSSLSGWGVSCNNKKSHGWWNSEEKKEHINWLELKAAFYGLKCFAENLKSAEILLRVDNTTAIAYINKMGSVKYQKLSKLCKEMWQWCERRNIWIKASYIQSSKNKEADSESRKISVDTEWEINKNAFKEITRTFGKFDVDLFATNINAKCKKFISWYPDPEAMGVDAFTYNWEKFYFYAFPPFVLIPKILQKIILDEAEGVLIVPKWPTQSWYPLFQQLLIAKPIYFSNTQELLISPFRTEYPTKITLVAGKLFGGLLQQKDIQKSLRK